MSDDVKIHFIFDKANIKKRLKWKDIKLLQKVRSRETGLLENLDRLQIIACRFMVDQNDQYIPIEQAFKIFDELSQEEAEDAIKKFTEAMAETAIPKASEMESASSSSVNSQVIATPPGGSES